MSHPSRQRESRDGRQHDIPRSEWAVAALGLVLVLGCLGFLAWSGLAGGERDIRPILRVTAIEQQDERYLVRLKVTNGGAGAAAALRVTARLQRGQEVIEEAETEFQYLPGHSSREAGLFFRHDPRSLTLELAARSYQAP